MQTLAQGAINRNLISLPKELFQCELINIFKNAQNALIMVMEKSWNVMEFSFENCVGILDDLVDYVNTFLKDLDLDYNYLIQVSMDGPNVNLSFKEKLHSSMEANNRTSFSDFGTYSYLPVHTAFRKRIKKLGFDLDEFFSCYLCPFLVFQRMQKRLHFHRRSYRSCCLVSLAAC